MRRILLAGLAVVLSGCSSSLVVKPLDPGAKVGTVVDGIPLRVPRTYRATLYALDSGTYKPITITNAPSVTVPDPTHMYVVGFSGGPLANPTVDIGLNDDGSVEHVNLSSTSQGQAAVTELGTQINSVASTLSANKTADEARVDAYSAALSDYFTKLQDYCTASKASPFDVSAVRVKAAALYGSEIVLQRTHDAAHSGDTLPFGGLVNPASDVGVGCSA